MTESANTETPIGRGRPKGSRNKLTLDTLALAGEGLTPVAFALSIMRDTERDADLRLNAAKLAAPYLHPKPQPEPRFVNFTLPENADTPAGLNQIHLAVLKAVAACEMSLDEAKEISNLIENQRRISETSELLERVKALETERGMKRGS